MPKRIKILFFYSNPQDQSRICLDEEVREIEQAIEASKFRDEVDLQVIHAPRLEDLRRALDKHQPQIVHFSGHGSKTQGIFIQDKCGNARPVRPQALAGLLKIIKGNLRLVIFNACYAASQAKAISQIVDFTIGMRDTIFDDNAIAFSVGFYEGLVNGRTIAECFELATNALSFSADDESKVPVLFAKQGVNPGSTAILPTKPSSHKTRVVDGTMQLELLVLGKGIPQVIKHWEYNTDADDPFFVTIGEEKKQITPRQAWQELSRLGRGRNSSGANECPVDIFLALRENAVETLINHDRLANLVEEALRYTAGNRLYLAWNQEDFPRLYENQPMLESWFSRLIRSGIADVIEIPRSALLREEIVTTLHLRALESEERRAKLQKLVSAEGWRILFRRPFSGKLSIETFIETFLADEQLNFDPCPNLAVFFDRTPKLPEWFKLLKLLRELKCKGNWFIAKVARIDDFDEFWKEEAGKFKPKYFDGVLEFHGCFEWLFALLRLQLATQLSRSTSPKVAGRALF
jgi:hypothetical protein